MGSHCNVNFQFFGSLDPVFNFWIPYSSL